jgi:hypothetical protein
MHDTSASHVNHQETKDDEGDYEEVLPGKSSESPILSYSSSEVEPGHPVATPPAIELEQRLARVERQLEEVLKLLRRYQSNSISR